MSVPRRQIIRPEPPPLPPANQRQIQKLRTNLGKERATLARWLVRLRRAFHAMEKSQRCVSRLERQLARLEE